MRRHVLPLALCLPACSTPGDRPATSTPSATAEETAAEAAAKLAALDQREHPPQPIHELSLLGGLVSGRVESRVAPKPDCREREGGSKACTLELEVGDLPIVDTPAKIFCTVTSIPVPFGPVVKAAQARAGLSETPRLTARELGSGLAVSFVADTLWEAEDGTFPGTLKVAALYAQGYTAVCADAFAGGRKTFERVVNGYFASLRFSANPMFPDLFAVGYRSRSGDRVDGVRYELVSRRNDGEAGYVELSTAFRLETDGKTWDVVDWGHTITRDDRGGLEVYRSQFWNNGAGPWTLSAKPSEGGRFRVKSEVGNQSDAIELTPKAPLSTELWSSLELQKVAAGKRKLFRYAQPSLEDGDPSFNYIELSRLGPGVVGEREVGHGELGGGKDKPAPTGTLDELHLDRRGVVVKEVATNSVHELIHTEGELPAPLSAPTRRTKRGRR